MSDLKWPGPSDQPVGTCHWEREGDVDRLVDQAGFVWQTFYRDCPQDAWSGSVQRHETMGDNCD